MKMALIGKDLWEIVTGEKVLNEDASQADRRKFQRRSNMALATICLSVAANIQIYVRSAANAKEAWENLEKHFEKKSLSQKIYYRRKIYSAKLEKGVSMFEHVNYLQMLSDHLEVVGDPIAENDLVIILISSFTEEFNHLMTALETIAEDRLTRTYVREKVIHEYKKLHSVSDDAMKAAKQDNALIARRNESKSSNSGCKKCFYCQKEDHYARNCYKKKADKRLKQKGESANTAELEGENEELALTTAYKEHNSDEWWIDSGASQHMPNDRSGMMSYVRLHSPRSIKLADNSILLAYGKGDVKVYVYNGPKKILSGSEGSSIRS